MKLKVILQIENLGYFGRYKELRQEYFETGELYGPDDELPDKLKRNGKDEKELERDAISRLSRILSDEGLIVHQIERID